VRIKVVDVILIVVVITTVLVMVFQVVEIIVIVIRGLVNVTQTVLVYLNVYVKHIAGVTHIALAIHSNAMWNVLM
jgi:hypothetical protein